MHPTLKATVLELLSGQTDMTIATVRSDGYPQATTVSYVNDGLRIYFGCAMDSQKAKNIARSNKVSLTVNAHYSDWSQIKGLSIGGIADRVTTDRELKRIEKMMRAKFPQVAQYGDVVSTAVAFFRVTPQVISVLDYTKAFGHTDLVILEPSRGNALALKQTAAW
jgi:general stress protein 26